MTTYNDKIYAIIRTAGTEELTLGMFPIQINRDPSDYELKEYHEYAPSLSEQFASCLCYKRPNYDLSTYEKDLRKRAIAFKESLQSVRRDNDVVAYSHRYGGWHTIGWQYNEDIKFLVDTNFGYGSASYMSVRFFYKDMQLAPYSNYIYYRYARCSDIIKYTYEYSLDYSEWKDLLNDTLLFYNAVTKHKEHEVFNWLRGHLSRLIYGLEDLKKATKSYRIYSNKRNVKDNVEGDDLILLKTDKIVGSYEFINNIHQLPTEVNPLGYIASIKRILNEFKPQLLEYSHQYKNEQTDLDAKINEISSVSDVDIYDRITRYCGKIYSWSTKSQRIEKIRIYLRIRNLIAPATTIERT